MAIKQTAETGHDITLATHLEHLDQSVECFNEIGESAMWELLHEMETGEEMQ